MTERKIKYLEASFEPEKISNRNAKYYNVLQTNYSTKISPYFSLAITVKAIKKKTMRKKYLWANSFK